MYKIKLSLNVSILEYFTVGRSRFTDLGRKDGEDYTKHAA